MQTRLRQIFRTLVKVIMSFAMIIPFSISLYGGMYLIVDKYDTYGPFGFLIALLGIAGHMVTVDHGNRIIWKSDYKVVNARWHKRQNFRVTRDCFVAQIVLCIAGSLAIAFEAYCLANEVGIGQARVIHTVVGGTLQLVWCFITTRSLIRELRETAKENRVFTDRTVSGPA